MVVPAPGVRTPSIQAETLSKPSQAQALAPGPCRGRAPSDLGLTLPHSHPWGL